MTHPDPAPAAQALQASQESFIYNNVFDVIYAFEVLGEGRYRFMSLNDRFLQTTGLRRDQVLGRYVEEVIPEPSLTLVLAKYRESILTRSTVRWEEVTEYPAGIKVGEVCISPVFDESGTCRQLIGLVHDVTERRAVETRLRESEERWRLALDFSGSAAWDWDMQTGQITYSRQWSTMLGLDDIQPVATREQWLELLHPADRPRIELALQAATTGSIGTFEAEHRMRHRNGRWIWVRNQGRLMRDASGAPVRMLGAVLDITAKKEADDLIRRQANFDALTGLPNRYLLVERLDRTLKAAHREQTAFAVLFVDLDNFKDINDTLGHSLGDRLLRALAERLVACVRETDTVARLGGDEFTILLHPVQALADADALVAERVAIAIQESLREPFLLAGESLRLSASIGITRFPQDGTNAEDLLKHADQAMFEAKRRGRNRFVYFSSNLQHEARHRRRMIESLRTAVRNGEMRLAFQPIVDLATGRIAKAEALVRWQHPVDGLIGPADFIPLCEQTGLIVEVGNWVMAEAARNVSRWRRLYKPDFQVSVNVSPAQFQALPHHPTAWLPHLYELDLPAGSLAVEVTESLLLDAGPEIEHRLGQLRARGVQISLDDFGTGYSSLSYLKDFRFDFLKIDRAFTSDLGDPKQRALCEFIIAMSHTLDMRVVAEGVETRQQLDCLRRAGCDLVQGWYFSRPVPSEAFESLMQADSCGAGVFDEALRGG